MKITSITFSLKYVFCPNLSAAAVKYSVMEKE